MVTKKKSFVGSLLGSSAMIQSEAAPKYETTPSMPKQAAPKRAAKKILFEEIKSAGDDSAQVILCDDRESALLIARFAMCAVWYSEARNIVKAAQAARERFSDSELIAALSSENSRLVGDINGKNARVLAVVPDSSTWRDIAAERGADEARRRFENALELARLLDRVRGRVSRGRVFQPMDANTILNTDYGNPVWAIDDLIPAGVTLLASRPKKGKSWLALQMALAVAQGVPFMGLNTKRGWVFYAALEDTPRRLQKRMKALGIDELTEETRRRLLFTTSFPVLSEEIGIPQLARIIVEDRPSLVIFDVWRRCQPEIKENGLNAQQKDYKAIFPLTCLAAETNTAILVLTHQNKQASKAGEMLDGVADSLGLSGAVDGIITLNRDGQSDTAYLQKEGREYERNDNINIAWQQGGGWRLVSEREALDRAAAQESESKRKIRLALERSVDESTGEAIPMKPAELVTATGMNKNTVRTVLARMKEIGVVIPIDGKYILNPVFSDTYALSLNNNKKCVKDETGETPETGETGETGETDLLFQDETEVETGYETGQSSAAARGQLKTVSPFQAFHENAQSENSPVKDVSQILVPTGLAGVSRDAFMNGMNAAFERLQAQAAEIAALNDDVAALDASRPTE